MAHFSKVRCRESALFILVLAPLFIYNKTYEEDPVFVVDDVEARQNLVEQKRFFRKQKAERRPS